MTQRPTVSGTDGVAHSPFDVGAATDRLFEDILANANNPLLETSINLLREETLATRAHEADLLPDREAEYQRLLDCWHRRDKAGLQRELSAYFRRREEIAKQVAFRRNHPI